MSKEDTNYASNRAIENIFVGRVASAPEFKRHGETDVTKFVLIDNIYAGQGDNDESLSRPLSIRFTAFDSKAEVISRNVRQGDQLFVTYTMRNTKRTDESGTVQYGYEFIVENFRFGAPGAQKRKELGERSSA